MKESLGMRLKIKYLVQNKYRDAAISGDKSCTASISQPAQSPCMLFISLPPSKGLAFSTVMVAECVVLLTAGLLLLSKLEKVQRVMFPNFVSEISCVTFDIHV